MLVRRRPTGSSAVKPMQEASKPDGNQTQCQPHACIVLLRLFGFGYMWILMLLRLVMFGLLLLPAFARLAFLYFTSAEIHRGIAYDRHSRCHLDVYTVAAASNATQTRPLSPVVVFVSGGAWIIGNKAWGMALGKALAEHGVVTVSVDYRNFPSGGVSDMVMDLDNAIAWVFNHIVAYGGDVSDVSLVGHSAGAHVAALSLLRQAQGERPVRRRTRLRRFIGLSGAYDIAAMAAHFHARGMYASVLRRVMEDDLDAASPTRLLNTASEEASASWARLPPVHLFHGDADATIPLRSSEAFAAALHRHQLHVTMTVLHGKSHTEPIIEDVVAGGDDPMLDHLLRIITGKGQTIQWSPLCPAALISAARFINPF